MDEAGRRIVTKTVTTTTYEKDTDEDGNIVILEKVQRRIFRTIYIGDEVVEEIEEPQSESESADTSKVTKLSEVMQPKTGELRLPAPSTAEDIVEHTEPDGRRVVTKTITTTTYETVEEAGELIILEKIHRRIIRTAYLGEKLVEEVEEPAVEPTVVKKTLEEIQDQVLKDTRRADVELPEPKTEEQIEERVDDEGRRIVTKTVTTTTYEKDTDEDGNIVILEKVQRRIFRTIYIGDEVVEEIEEPDTVPDTQNKATPKSDDVKEVVKQREVPSSTAEEIRLPAPSTVEDVVEHTEPDGRRVVKKTITTTTYEIQEVSGTLVIYEKIHRRILQTVYLGEEVIEETEEPAIEPTVVKRTPEEIGKIAQNDTSAAEVELPEPRTEEKTEERVDEEGRRIVIKTVTTTTYEKDTDEDGNIVILEKVQRRIFRTIYVGDEVVEEIEEPDTVTDSSSKPTQLVEDRTTQKPPELVARVEELRLPAPSTVEDVVERTEPDGRRVVTKTITTTTYEAQEEAGELVIYDKIHRRVIRTVYLGENVVEEVEEPAVEPTVAKKTSNEIQELVRNDASVVDVELPEPKTEESTEEKVDNEGRRIVTKTVTTTTYEKDTDEDGNIVILEKVQRRIFRTIYVGDEVVEEIEEPDTVADTESKPTSTADDTSEVTKRRKVLTSKC